MLEKLTREDFEKLVGQSVEVDFGEAGKLAGKLAAATASKSPSKDREPFSLEFHCPHPAPPEQGIYKVSHAELGELDLFLVPVHGDDEGVIFEAVFN